MSSPSLKDLPKVAVDLKSQLEGFSTGKLQKIDTQEKIVLPSAEGNMIISSQTIYIYRSDRRNDFVYIKILKCKVFSDSNNLIG